MVDAERPRVCTSCGSRYGNDGEWHETGAVGFLLSENMVLGKAEFELPSAGQTPREHHFGGGIGIPTLSLGHCLLGN